MSEDIFQALQKKLDAYSIGFPATESGVELRLLRKLFSEEDARLFLDMSLRLEGPSEVAERTGRDLDETAAQLAKMADNGLLFRHHREGRVVYGATAFVVGFYEYQMKRMDLEFAELVEAYFEEMFQPRHVGDSVMPLRTVPVHRSVTPDLQVAPYRSAREIIKTKEKIALADCICRLQQKILHKNCDLPVEVCFVFGSHADYYLENNLARIIDQEEALAILDKCEEAGLVNQPASTVNPGGMCNCCGDCCGLLRLLNKQQKPAEMVLNNYWAEVSQEDCTGCETCIDRCHMDAVVMTEEGIAAVNQDRCIGCGLCVTTCPEEAITLALKPEALRREPFDSNMELALETARTRGVVG